MVQHIIIWNFKDDMTVEQKQMQAQKIKDGLESLADIIPGILSIRVQQQFLDSSNGDLLLLSCFESKQALDNYTTHPAHVKVATEAVRPFMKDRRCVDFLDE